MDKALSHHSTTPSFRQAEIQISAMTAKRQTYFGNDLPIDPPGRREDAFEVVTQLVGFRSYKVWRAGELFYEGGCSDGALRIHDMREEWRHHHLSPFDCVSFHIPFSEVQGFAMEAGRPDFCGLQCEPQTTDGVIHGLAQALVPALENPNGVSRLFLDQIGLALLVHLTHKYGSLHFATRRKGMLAPWQEKRAMEFLAAHVTANFSVADLAEACELSRSHFIKAFKETVGKTPYRWLIEYRVSKCKDMLLSSIPIVDIALACGFADQSHMTRVFAEVTGETPGTWRRRNRTS